MQWNRSEAHKPFSSQWALGFFFWIREHLNIQFLERASEHLAAATCVCEEGAACQRRAGREVWTKACGDKKKKQKTKTLAGMEDKLEARERWETHSSAWGEIVKDEEEEKKTRERQEEQKKERDGGGGLALLWGSRYLQWAVLGLWMGRKHRKTWMRNFLSWLAVRHLPLTHPPSSPRPVEDGERDAVKTERTQEKAVRFPANDVWGAKHRQSCFYRGKEGGRGHIRSSDGQQDTAVWEMSPLHTLSDSLSDG